MTHRRTHINTTYICDFLNRYSLLFHAVLSLTLCFIIELISRRSLGSALAFLDESTWAFAYNAFIIFTSLSLVYLVRRRAFARIVLSGFWLFLGTINGCVLSNRVTPFGFTDLKCIPDLLAMKNTSYFTAFEAFLMVCGVCTFIGLCVLLYMKGPKFNGVRRKYVTPALVALSFLLLPVTTQAAQNSNILASYFANIAQGYENYGFVYGFSTSVVDRGMSKPENYTKETVTAAQENSKKEETTNPDTPNIIVVLLESFVDPTELNFLELSEDPIPNFHTLEETYSTGYLTVPVVGAGTANTEFEILTGMSMQYFGTGEYPYKTVLKQTPCESIASALSGIGYGTHAVHNNGGNFYSRAKIFSQMGFDSFISKEMMNITEYTPLDTWAKDDILIGETIKALDSTENQSDFVYTITVQAHGDYPTEPVLENPAITVNGGADEAANYQWEYYVNMIHEVDSFIGDFTSALAERDENTMVVFFGDHVPTLGLEDSQMGSGSTFKTKYITWNNFNLPKEDADLMAYELLANTTNQLGIHEGTIFTYEQNAIDRGITGAINYLDGLNHLQYDLLYGKKYAYNGMELHQASNLQMGVEDVVIQSISLSTDQNSYILKGKNFTPWSKVFVNGEKVDTTYESGSRLRVNIEHMESGDEIVVNQMGSSNTIFRSSNGYVWAE